MSQRDNDSTGRTIALVGGGALLLWLLLRGRGWGLGGRGDADADARRPDDAPSAPTGPPCRIRIDAEGIQVDGTRSDVPATVARCQAAGTADVAATGDAIVGAVTETVRALQAQGVAVRASPAIWALLDAASPRKP